ncbi:MAG: CehA/McbA family metallohydrolase [Candidatus Bathyarchaeia archaeon]
MPLKIDLHVHTCYSKDAFTTLDELVIYAKKRGLDGVAITDHNTVEASFRIKEKDVDGLVVIPGIEVTTNKGHMVGLNITEAVPKDLEPSETAEIIHEMGGIAVAVHSSTLIRKGLGLRSLQKDVRIDAVEVINSSSFPFFLSTYLSKRIAAKLGLPQIGGSDSHIPEAIGFAYTVIDADRDLEEIIRAIKGGLTTPYGRSMPWRLRLKKIMQKRGVRV